MLTHKTFLEEALKMGPVERAHLVEDLMASFLIYSPFFLYTVTLSKNF